MSMPSYVSAAVLEPEGCSLDLYYAVYFPIDALTIYFDGAIGAVEHPIAAIYEGDKPVAIGKISIENYVGKKRTQGYANVVFETPLYLPKGKEYVLVVPKDEIFSETDPSVTNDELRYEFIVPEAVFFSGASIDDGATVMQEEYICFHFCTETEPIEGKTATLYREGVPVRSYTPDVGWDWNLGQAWVYLSGEFLGDEIKFEAGINYHLVLPEGSVSARLRTDIVNEEASVSFIGGCEDFSEPLQFIGCSVSENESDDVIGEVEFVYDNEIILCGTPKIQLVEDKFTVCNEVTPKLTQQRRKWVLSADFEAFPLAADKEYEIVIPESTVVTAKGDVVVNRRNVIPVGRSGVQNIVKGDSTELIVAGNGLHISRISSGSEVEVYSVEGAVIYSGVADSSEMSVDLPGRGIYIVTINGSPHKLISEP